VDDGARALHVVAIVFNNAAYSVLNVELERVGAAQVGPKARRSSTCMPGAELRAAGPGHGRARGAHRSRRGLLPGLEYALAHPGPHLIEALVPESLSGRPRKLLPWLLRSLPSLPPSVARALKRTMAP
jgi:acetolactate synthase-1/2/3 large subunit